jgi:hypothetical protein
MPPTVVFLPGKQEMKLNLAEIKELVDQLAEKIGASQNILPTYGYSEQSGRPQIEVDSRGYQFVVAERGNEFERFITDNIDDLLYKIFAGVTFWLSCQYELARRIEEQDCRRIIFHHQLELLSMLSPEWGERESQEHEQILKKHPFYDFASIRATHYGNLIKQGYSSEAADKIVYEKYPLPKRN